MTIPSLLGASWTAIGAAALGTLAIYAVVIISTRISGLRTFAKMSSFDFAATIATGSILASVALTSAPLVLGIVAIAMLLGSQRLIAVVRQHDAFSRVVDNNAVLLMDGAEVLEDNLRATGVTRPDILAKLREANVTRFDQIRYVVLETTGDVSVLHAPPEDPPVDEDLLHGVIRDVS